MPLSIPFALATTLILATITAAHMQLFSPPPFNSTNNPHRTTAPDPYLQYPYACCGPGSHWAYPCHGYLSLLNTSDGAPTATWPAGSTQNFSLAGIGNHYGGSCQVGFSADGGETFRVVRSFEGDCPHRNNGEGPEGQGFDFEVPRDLRVGVKVFAWTWFNREQEFSMSCAAVIITAGSLPSTPTTSSTAASSISASPASKCTCVCPNPLPTDISACSCSCQPPTIQPQKPRRTDSAISFDSRPEMFVADTFDHHDGSPTGCLTPHTTAELKFPDPGLDVVAGDGVYALGFPFGECGGKAGGEVV